MTSSSSSSAALSSSSSSSFRKSTLSQAQKAVLAMSRGQYLEAIRATRPADKLYVGVCIFRRDVHSSRPSVLLLRRPSSASVSSSPSSSASSSTRTATAVPVSSYSRRQHGYGSRQHQRQHSTSTGNSSRGGEAEARVERGSGGSTGGTWELPGGKVGDEDFCISAAVAQRVAEQTGLRVVRVLGALQEVRRVAEVRILDWDDDGVGIFTGTGAGSGSLSVLDGATLTSATNSRGNSSSSSSGGGGGTRGGSGGGPPSRRSPIHNPQLVLRKECLQLNYAVLVQSHEGLSVRSRDHDELVWASFSRAEALPMPEELRTVVHQGLAFAGEYLF